MVFNSARITRYCKYIWAAKTGNQEIHEITLVGHSSPGLTAE